MAGVAQQHAGLARGGRVDGVDRFLEAVHTGAADVVEDIFHGTVAGERKGLAVDHGVGPQSAVAETGHVLEAGPLG